MKENKTTDTETVHTASYAMYESLVKKLIKTNAVFRVSGSIYWGKENISEEVLIHPFKHDPMRSFRKMAYRIRGEAKKNDISVINWNVRIYEGSASAMNTLKLFNTALTLCADPLLED